jgi:ureidoacrylate peracid hydrolase
MRDIWGKTVFETLKEVVDPAHTAVLVIDVQNEYCLEGGHFEKNGYDLSMIRQMLPRLKGFLEKAREKKVPVAFIQQTAHPEGKTESPAWLYFRVKDGKSPFYTIDGTWGHDFVEGIRPINHEAIVKKARSSAFVNTNLDLLLRSMRIQSVIVTGVVTQGCVDSTARDASFYDYYTVVVSDCVASHSRELHECSLKVLSTRMDVVESKAIVKAWE